MAHMPVTNVFEDLDLARLSIIVEFNGVIQISSGSELTSSCHPPRVESTMVEMERGGSSL